MSIAYVVRCDQPGCHRLAEHKIASAWSDSLTAELKTYALVCADCLTSAYAKSRDKQAKCRLAKHETLESPGIYDIARGQRDRELKRRSDLEEQLRSE